MIGILIYIIVALLIAPIGKNRRIGFWKTFMWALLLTPFITIFIAMNSGRLDALGCKHCGNKENEVEFCGICGKNEQGLTKYDFKELNKGDSPLVRNTTDEKTQTTFQKKN